MSGLQITITTAGRAALVNPGHTGTAARRVSHIGVTTQSFVANAGMTTLPGERKRLTTFAGNVVAADTIHVMLRDDSNDVYSLRGLGLYLDDGTLFALHGQANVLLEKSAQAMMVLSADIMLADLTATTLSFGDTNWINPPATTETQGVVELATPDEGMTGTDTRRAMTPAANKAALDARLGASAPSTYVKSLLDLATATALRLAIGLKSASLKDEGAGNGLDADTLDGQHGDWYRQWSNMLGVPTEFTPNRHGHAWSEISNPPATAIRWPSWTEVVAKPNQYPPTNHVHAWGEITSGVPDTATRWPRLTEVSGLEKALSERAALSGAEFSGSIIMSGNGKNIKFLDDNKSSANLEIGAGYNNTSDHHAFIYNRWNDGFIEIGAAAGATKLRISRDNVKINGNPIWHAGNLNPDAKANLTGATFSGEVISTGVHSYRMVNGRRGAFWRHDGQNLYLMITKQDDPYGQWEKLPLRINLATGLTYLTGRPMFGDSTPWDSANFDPKTKASINHEHGWNEISGKPATYTPAPHNHIISDVSELQSTLDGKAATSHSHAIADIAGLAAALDPGHQYAENGWAKLPGGLIIQWGVYRPAADSTPYPPSPPPGDGDITQPLSQGGSSNQERIHPKIIFPTAFPQSCFAVTTTDLNPTGTHTADAYSQLHSSDKSGFLIYTQHPHANLSLNYFHGCTWIAIGC